MLMKNETLSLITGFIAMALVMISYFVKKKQLYLFFQSCCIIFLILSYLFNAQYFATVGLGIGFLRSLTFYIYEKEDKVAPSWLAFLFSGLTLIAYFIVNKSIQPLDLLCLASLVMYAFIFRLRNLKAVRFLMLLPLALSVAFNITTSAAIFVTCSYSFELGADIVSIFKYHVFGEKQNKTE